MLLSETLAGDVGHSMAAVFGSVSLDDSLLPLVSLARTRALQFPALGTGDTWRRLCMLVDWGQRDVAAARIVEAHADASAILQEFGRQPAVGLLGVWAAEDRVERLEARMQSDGFVLDGVKRWCSGAEFLDAALVTAWVDQRRQLFLVRISPGLEVRRGSWETPAMARCATQDVEFRSYRVAREDAIGAPDSYFDRPGFWHGAIGVAACWHGGALGIAQTLSRRVRERPDPHRLAHLGAVEAALLASGATLRAAAQAIDDDPHDSKGTIKRWAFASRAAVERAASEVVERTGRALGSEPLAHDADHARRVADVTLYLRQSHAEADLACLGELIVSDQ